MGTAIESEIPCIQCGYNLRTLEETGRCPECGAAILQSVLNAQHRLGIKFLRRAGRAAWWMGILNLLALAAALSCIAVMSSVRGRNEDLAGAIFVFSFIAIVVLQIVAAWRSTVGIRERRLKWRTVWVIRISAAGLGVAAFVGLLMSFMALDVFSFRGTLREALSILFLIFISSIFPLIFGVGWHYAAICQEVGDEAKARGHQWMSAMLALGLLTILLGMITMAFIRPWAGSAADLLALFACMGFLLGAIGYFGWTLFLLATGNALRDAVKKGQSP